MAITWQEQANEIGFRHGQPCKAIVVQIDWQKPISKANITMTQKQYWPTNVANKISFFISVSL